MTIRTGIRGGHVRSVEEARGLQETFKAEISAKVRRSIVSTLLARGRWHADDSAHLEIPAEHLNCVGAQVSGLVRRGYMVEVGRRRAASAASNGRKSGIFQITDLGRRKLVGVSGDTFLGGSAGTPPVTADSGAAPSAGSGPPFLPPAEEPPAYETSLRRHRPRPDAALVWSWIPGEPPAYWRWAA